ncbi:hypothetical protein B484DRAFT_414484 [Ochromonadaceae sp. CCMP2298]|nr:hypothetical protein B484DRAFT_414484 [Ochromonadaceae sp. CCMP2298]
MAEVDEVLATALGNLHFCGDEVPGLLAMRVAYKCAVTDNNEANYVDVIVKTWRLCAGARDAALPLRIHPLFEAANAVMPIVRVVATNAFKIERFALNNGSGVTSGGNVLLQGVKGVGKTTLLHGLYRVLGVLSSCLVPLFYDFTTGFIRPLDLVRAYAQQLATTTTTPGTMRELLLALQLRKRYIVFFADEIQLLYKPNATAGDATCAAVADLLAIGKTDNAFGVVAGSTSALRSLTFRGHVAAGSDKVDPYRAYVDLNNTVYVAHDVSPLRKRDEVRGVLQQRADTVATDNGALAPVSDTLVDAVFTVTGGIGRLIDAYSADSPACCNADSFIAAYENDASLRAVVSFLFTESGGTVAPLETAAACPLWEPITLRPQRIQQLLTGVGSVTSLMHDWADRALLHMDSSGSVQFFCALHYNVLLNFLYDGGQREPLLELAMRTTLGGWKGKGSAGVVIEEYLLARYAVSNDSLSTTYEPRKLTFAAGGPTTGTTFALRAIAVAVADDNGGGGGAADDFMTLSMLEGVLFDVAVDHGLDGFVMLRNAEKEAADGNDGGGERLHFDVHTTQVKTGERGSMIGEGTVSSKRDTTMHGIIAKARLGAEKFRAAVVKVFADENVAAPTLTFRTFTLLTTKSLNADAHKSFSVGDGKTTMFGCDEVVVEVIDGADCLALMEEAYFLTSQTMARCSAGGQGQDTMVTYLGGAGLQTHRTRSKIASVSTWSEPGKSTCPSVCTSRHSRRSDLGRGGTGSCSPVSNAASRLKAGKPQLI